MGEFLNTAANGRSSGRQVASIGLKMWLGWVLGGLMPLGLAAQIRAVASFDRPSVEAGDTAVLRVQVTGVQAAPQRVNLAAWLPLLTADDIRPPSPWRRAGEYWVQTTAIVLLDTGRLTLPPLPVLLQVGDPVLTNPLEINVTAPRVPADLNAMAPIRDIRRSSATWYDYWPAALAAALAIAVALWWRQKRCRPTPPPPTPEPARPSAQDIALQKLDALAREKPWTQPDRIGEYYAALSWIVREFLENEYNFPALEQTTTEIARSIAKTPFPVTLRADLQRLLEQADWVKFANAQPEAERHKHWLQTARRICKTDAA
ncbi:MAG: hypothetical protein RMJ33_12895 [Saprospiraceae bacterium]|nr:hypothetical protein [Saprospiraceae bacterium]MDW8230725.1 hypothetical protein [Saprospiraceae bacterium]